MSSLSCLRNPAGYHILSYGTLIGSTLFQSFINGIVAFRVLPRAQFSTLQKNIFPIYFALQTIAPLCMIATYPAGWRALVSGSTSAASASSHRLPFYLISTLFLTGAVNFLFIGPATTQVMQERKKQETRDGKKSYDKGPHSSEMEALNRKFGMLHGVSSLVNLVGIMGMVWYAFVLGEGLDVVV
ncbi:uncharacterized protein EI97DRAFT_434356 [Westerdykella ornata]|uniref:TMEM205-like domain-containing protein n=1 Tax=Westerdykella ornata TaxID=318751 RepID=A0A6A6JGQ1_WESOR|nr:uncharacterized protein EI97DRAFT_434356 [Westerdykella ornata]KAF2275527.1 hypothetical protein EI97DRAFT_434356 [Westerdykella ornata]